MNMEIIITQRYFIGWKLNTLKKTYACSLRCIMVQPYDDMLYSHE